MSLELDNRCNAFCLFCRDQQGQLYDSNPNGSRIPQGAMPLEIAKKIIDQLSPLSLIAILYTNGEPLIYEHLSELIRFATDRRLATMISTNGQLLTEDRSEEILDAGLDFIKIAISGFSQKTYQKEVRHGNIETVKKNIRNLVYLNNQKKYRTMILVDFIVYDFNRFEIPQVRQFCKKLKLTLNFRPGNPRYGLADQERPLTDEKTPLQISCDWIWKGIQINWDGVIHPCCECAIWSNALVYEIFDIKKTDLIEVFNGPEAKRMRKILCRKKGRETIPICNACLRRGVAFKW